MSRPITVGVVGVSRGRTFARGSEAATGLRLVALCDTWEERLEQERRELAAARNGGDDLYRLRAVSPARHGRRRAGQTTSTSTRRSRFKRSARDAT